MIPARIGIAVCFVLLSTGVCTSHELNDDTFEKWRDFIRPSEEELQWTRVPWRTMFWEAMEEANAADRPVLLWAMNGHPIGCT